MKLRLFVFLIFFLSTIRAFPQPPEDIYKGNIAKSEYSNDGFFGPFYIGFNFTFYNNPYIQFFVSPNGLVTFGTGQDSPLNAALPSAAAPNNFIAAFWDDLLIDPFGSILYTTIGAAPNRKLIVQFRNMAFYGGPPYMGTFSIILYESTNKIQVQYRMIVLKDNPRAGGNSATIGLENVDGTSGIQYSYQDPGAASTSRAISFTPSGGTYSTDPDATYYGIYLTTNLILPEPGICDLISPTEGAVVGIDNTFEWTAAPNTSTYALQIATNPDLISAVSYNAGSELSYTLNGLLPETTYYWTVFTSNTTGTTWSEVKSFTTSSTPPLNPVPRTIWAEQLQDKTIMLQYTGGDASPKTATLTTLPLQGQLYQYNAGTRGAQISSVPAIVTDAGRNVIYAATGSPGNGTGNFNFKITDAGGDSPEGTITINVSPPGIPNVMYTAKSTTAIEIQLDIPMADPAGKQDQFGVTVNGTPATISAAGLKIGDPYTIVLTLATTLSGTETVLVSYTQGDVTGSTGGFLLSFSDQTVTLRSQIITFPLIPEKQYGNPPFNPGATSSSGLAMAYSSSNLSVATVSASNVTIVGAGTSEITARQAGNATYAPAKHIKTLTVAKADQTITFNPLPLKTYGDEDFALTATTSSGLIISYSSDNTAVATVIGNMVHIVGAGSAVITASQPGNKNYNPAVSVPNSLLVKKAVLTASADDKSRTYGDINPPFTITYAGFAGTDNETDLDVPPIATTTAQQSSDAGDYDITPAEGSDNNYTFSYTNGTLTINKADQTLTFGELTGKTYGEADFSISAAASSGLSVTFNSDEPSVATVTGNSVHIAGAGTAVITASQTGNQNYNPAPSVPQTLNVSKKGLTFTADNKSRVYLAQNPPLTYSISGFVNGDLQSVLNVLPAIQTTATESSPVNNYPITISGGSDNNYDYAYLDGILTVTKLYQALTFSGVPSKLLAQDTYTLVATSPSGLPVMYESLDGSVASVSGDLLTGVSKGTVQIRAYHYGNENYEPAEAFAMVEVTTTHKDIMYLFTPNNDGINDQWELPLLSTWGQCDVKVYNRWGKLVFANADYNNDWNGTSSGTPVPEGPYYFIIKTENAGVVKGTVNIVR